MGVTATFQRMALFGLPLSCDNVLKSDRSCQLSGSGSNSLNSRKLPGRFSYGLGTRLGDAHVLVQYTADTGTPPIYVSIPCHIYSSPPIFLAIQQTLDYVLLGYMALHLNQPLITSSATQGHTPEEEEAIGSTLSGVIVSSMSIG